MQRACPLAFAAFVFVLAIFAASAAAVEAEPSWHAMLSAMAEETGAPSEVRLHAVTGQARFLRLGRPARSYALGPAPDDAVHLDAAESFLAAYGRLFGLSDPGRQLVPLRPKAAGGGGVFRKFQQQHRGIPVYCGQLVVQTDGLGRVATVSGEVAPDPALGIEPVISADEAGRTAVLLTAKHHAIEAVLLQAAEPELTVYDPRLVGGFAMPASLVWKVVVTARCAPVREVVLVDATRGFVALDFNQVPEAGNRSVYDKNNNSESPALPGLPEELARAEGGDPSPVSDVNDAYDYLGLTYDFYAGVHGRESIDGAGMALVATTRFCDSGACPFANAFWNGLQMVFGEGFASALDVVAHELTHGVTEHESNLIYIFQSGAINESLSDVWGETIELTYQGGPPWDRWLVGEALPGGAIRDMADPAAFGSPDSMTSPLYVCNDRDMGGVHTNSGVGNKAYALAVDGGSFNGVTVLGIGLDKAIRIWYRAAAYYLTQASDYDGLADALRASALDLVGQDGITEDDAAQIESAVAAVHMDEQPLTCPRVDAAVCPAGRSSDVFSDGLENGSGNWFSAPFPPGQTNWDLITDYAHSGRFSLYCWDPDTLSDISIHTADIAVPAGARLHFFHTFAFETGPGKRYDGGVVEYSVDGGSTWLDAGELMEAGGYNGRISTGWQNPLAERQAFTALSGGYWSTRIDLAALAGRTVRFRFRLASDLSGSGIGWFVDDVRIATCGPVRMAVPLTLLLF